MRTRKVIVSFPDETGSSPELFKNRTELDGLNVRFTTKVYSQAGIPAEAYIDIYNLNREDLQRLTTSVANWLKKQTLIELRAGYDNDVKTLFKGMIMDATPEGNPDISLHIKGLSGIEWMSEVIRVNKNNITIKGLLQTASDAMGYPLNISEKISSNNKWLNRVIDNFSFTGSPFELLAQIQAMVGGYAQDENSIIITCYNGEIFVWALKEDKSAPKLVVSAKTGMIGYPKLTATGVNVKMLLNPSIKVGDSIYLQSERVPLSNGNYFVTSILHQGELRGNEFYTTLECAHPSNIKEGFSNV